MESFNIDDFDNPPPPPRYLYKYLSAGRVGSVLGLGTARFTPLMNTNDSFEIRSTFRKLVGPRFRQMLAEQMDVTLTEDSIRRMTVDVLKEQGLDWLPPELALQLVEQHYGQNFMGMMREQMVSVVDNVLVPHLNDPGNMEGLLEKLGRELLCFSLSERMDSAPMWAHYADNNRGFVVAFDTEHEWFRRRKDGKETRLQKVSYFDGRVEEPLENVSAALISKTTDWAYEREWRLYVKEDQVDQVVGDSSNPIHLLEFPSDAIDRVILGSNASDEMTGQIRATLSSNYPRARLFHAVPNRTAHTYNEVPVR